MAVIAFSVSYILFEALVITSAFPVLIHANEKHWVSLNRSVSRHLMLKQLQQLLTVFKHVRRMYINFHTNYYTNKNCQVKANRVNIKLHILNCVVGGLTGIKLDSSIFC